MTKEQEAFMSSNSEYLNIAPMYCPIQFDLSEVLYFKRYGTRDFAVCTVDGSTIFWDDNTQHLEILQKYLETVENQAFIGGENMEERRSTGNATTRTGSCVQEEPQSTQCVQAVRSLGVVVENLRSTINQMGMRLQPLTGDMCKPPMAVKPLEKNLVPFAAELEIICQNLREIEHDINFILDHVEL